MKKDYFHEKYPDMDMGGDLIRERIIIEELLNHKTYLKLDYFADKLGVSTRTIRNDIKNIEKDYKNNGFCLEYKTKLGYFLKIEDDNKFKGYLDKLPNYIVESPEQRIESIIVELLMSEGYKTIESISNEFMVSSSQIKNDLKKIDEKLKDFDLKLERKPHYGIRVSGKIDNMHEILQKLYKNKNRKIVGCINQFMDNSEIENIKNTIKDIFNKYSIEANITEFEEIVSQTIILYTKLRLREGTESSDVFDKSKDIVINELINKVFEWYSYYFTKEENDYLVNLIKSKTKVKNKTSNEINHNRLNTIISDFFKDIDQKYKTNFSEDYEFFNLLYLHIASLIERVKRNRSVSNPFSIQISQQYPTVFNLSIQLSKLIEKEYGIKINQNEIGFIATHIAVPFEKREKANFDKRYKIAIICSSGGGSAYLIKLRLSEIFHNAELENFSLMDRDEVIEFEPDFIFSITDLEFDTSAPVILINEILDELDYLDIKESVMLADQIGSTSPKEYILSLFSKNHFKCIKEKKEYKDILYEMAQKISEEGVCSKNYPNDVWERESYLSTVYANGVAIPHPIEMTGNKNMISVALIQDDVEYNNKKVNIVFMVSLIKGNIEIHRQISKYLTKVMMDEKIVEMLKKSQSYEEFIYKLKIYIGG